MNIVLYLFRGVYNGSAEYEYNHPEIDAIHDGILFLAQDGRESQYETATKECAKFGFYDVDFKNFVPLDVEILNTDQYRGFVVFYEEALQKGSSLVYYPNS